MNGERYIRQHNVVVDKYVMLLSNMVVTDRS